MANNLDRDMMQKIVALVEELQSGGASLDVQINGVSIVEDGVANIPIASSSRLGVVYAAGAGLVINTTTGQISVQRAADEEVKAGSNNAKPIVPISQNISTFYGLAKAAGDTTQSESNNPVGQYTDTAKEKIRDMIGSASYGKVVETIDITTQLGELDKNYNEIVALMDESVVYFIKEDSGFHNVFFAVSYGEDNGKYIVTFYNGYLQEYRDYSSGTATGTLVFDSNVGGG